MAASVLQTTEELVKDIQEDFLTCTICIERYERPKILPCHHTFCEKCLVTDVKKSDGSFDCPTCRMPCKLPDDGIEGLENNFFMNSLLEKMQKTPTESHEIREHPIKCEICDEGDITHICIDCLLQKFCESCAKMHRKARISSKHTILTLEKYKEKRSKNPSAVLPISHCNIHKENPAKFFCDTCQVPICSECTVIEHPNKSHDYKYLNDVAAEYSAKLSENVRQLKEKADKIDESKRAAIKILEFYNDKPKAEKAKIRAKAADLINKITVEENALKAEVTEEYDVRIKNQEIHNDDLHFRYSRLVSMINYLEFISQYENATQLMSSEDRVKQCILELEGLEQKPDIDHGEVEFVPAAETDSLVGELINMANESNVADPQNRGRTTTLKNAVTVADPRKVIKTESKTLGNNIEIDALTDSVPKLLHANFLICRICFEQFSNPKILPCHHTFCEKCLRKENSNKLDCPSCKESCQLTDDGVSGLPNNTYLQSLSAKVPQSAKEYVVLNGKCSICNKVTATHVCIWRQIDLCCSECSKIVKNITKKTLATDECVLTIQEYKKFRSDDPTKVQTMSYCKSHKGYLINLYCNTCKSPICSACTESVHPKEKHRINFLKNVSDDYRKGLVESIRNLNKQATVARERKREGKLLQNNFEMKCGDRVRSISRKAKTMHEKVKLEETTILEDLEKKYSVKVKKTQSDIDELQIKYGKLVSMVSYIEMMRHHKNAAELMAAKRNLNQKIDELLEMDNTSVVQKIIVEFQPCDDGRRGDLVGVLRSDVCITQCTVDGVPQRLIKGQSVDLLITTRDHRGKAVNPNQKVKVTLTLPDGSYKDVKVTENGDGTHTVTVHGEVIGDYKVSISVSGQAIPGSPFDFRVLIPLVKTLGKKERKTGASTTLEV
ncbi:uncharacterized protein [Ptychodera flava]|uniref:uncharacterized protein n=1 Tax=Ptychodera flava TaxID=63121 RepID=UPI00396A55DE